MRIKRLDPENAVELARVPEGTAFLFPNSSDDVWLKTVQYAKDHAQGHGKETVSAVSLITGQIVHDFDNHCHVLTYPDAAVELGQASNRPCGCCNKNT